MSAAASPGALAFHYANDLKGSFTALTAMVRSSAHPIFPQDGTDTGERDHSGLSWCCAATSAAWWCGLPPYCWLLACPPCFQFRVLWEVRAFFSVQAVAALAATCMSDSLHTLFELLLDGLIAEHLRVNVTVGWVFFLFFVVSTLLSKCANERALSAARFFFGCLRQLHLQPRSQVRTH